MECILDKTLVIISGGIEAVPGIKLAKEMGLYVVVSDGDNKAPGFDYADDQIIASTYNVDDTVQKVKNYNKLVRKIDGVICIASDVPLTVASAIKELGLSGISVETARLAMDKLAMKNKFCNDDIPTPDYKQIHNFEDLIHVVKNWDYPIVMKPVDNRGARGVLRLTKGVDLEWAWNHALENSPSGRVMVERFLDGPQVSTEAMIIDSIGYPIGFTDRNYEYIEKFSPYIIENGGGFPSHLSPGDQLSISDMSIKAGLALGIKNGIAKGDMVLTDDGPKVIEIAARLSGGWFSTDQIPLGLGIDLIGLAIKLVLGEKINTDDLKPQFSKGVAIRYFFPKPGKVREIRNIEKFKDINWIYRLSFFVKVGDVVEKTTNHTNRAGFVITSGVSYKEAIERANEVVNNIDIITVPV